MTGVVAWITGRPSSGKSTLAERARDALRAEGLVCCVLDGDAVRRALGGVYGYDDAGREAFYRALAELAALLAAQGLVVLVPATAHRRAFREYARAATEAFVEVHVDVDHAECARRDAKGLYAATKEGTVTKLPGEGVAFEEPRAPDVVARGGHDAEALVSLIAAVRRFAP